MLWFVFSEEKDDTVLPEKPSGTESGFYYENLDDTEKIAYELIMAEIENLPQKIQIPNLDDEEIAVYYLRILDRFIEFGYSKENAEKVMYIVVDLVGSVCSDAVLYSKPFSIEEIRGIVRTAA